MIVKCSDGENLCKLTEYLATCKELNVRKPEPLKAVITILGVEEEECKGDLIKSMMSQNPELTSLVPDGGNVKDYIRVVRYARMGANARLWKVFIMVSANARVRLNELKQVYIGYKRVRVVDDTPLLQCFKCLGFGHLSMHCKNTERCGYCAEGHRTNECPVKNECSKYKCYNCKKYMNVDAVHRASSYEYEFYKRTQVNVESRTVGREF